MIEVPEVAQPRPIKNAQQLLREREQDVEAARRALLKARAAVEEARALDLAGLADALDVGATAATPAEDAARRDLAEAERLVLAHELRRDRARAAFEDVLAQSVGPWGEALVKSIRASEETCVRLVDELEAADGERASARAALNWLNAYERGAKLPRLFTGPTPTTLRMNQNAPTTWSINELLRHVRGGLDAATLEVSSDTS